MTGACSSITGLSPSVEPASGLAGSAASIPSAGFDWYRLLPRYWFQNHPTNREWDGLLNQALDHFMPVSDGPTRLSYMVGPFEVWAGNWPYAYGSPRYEPMLPCVATRLRLKRAISGLSEKAAMLASVIEAQRAETHSGSVHESAVPQADAHA